MSEPTPAAVDRQIQLQKIYLKDASFEVPRAPQVFTRQWQPQIDVQIATAVQTLGPEQFQIVLTVTVTAKLDADVAFLAEVQQGGIFQLHGFSENSERQKVLGTECVRTLFPFAREAVAELIQRGGFPQVLLQPVNFDALYDEHVARASQPAATSH